jgi:hypothetical protein
LQFGQSQNQNNGTEQIDTKTSNVTSTLEKVKTKSEFYYKRGLAQLCDFPRNLQRTLVTMHFNF